MVEGCGFCVCEIEVLTLASLADDIDDVTGF